MRETERGRSAAKTCLLVLAAMVAATALEAAEPLRLITLAPGHHHAALFQKDMLPGISEEVRVYAPLGPDLAAHLNRIAQFNAREDNPTRWKEKVYAGADYWERMLSEMPGNVVVLSGANDGKIDRIGAIVERGVHALADKPWIIEPGDLAKLEAVLEAAERGGVVAYDGMTQRHEISYLVQRELVNDAGVFGKILPGSATEPAVYMESVHYLLKLVAGVPNRRPPWYFDIRQQGEGLADVGTHMVDLVQWILLPSQPVDYRRDIRVLQGKRWPTVLALADFQRVTGEQRFPEYLSDAVRGEELRYYCNNSVLYTVRGVHVKLDVKWGLEASDEKRDTELAFFRGSRSRVELRKGKVEDYHPEVYVAPNRGEQKSEVKAAVERKLESLAKQWPGLAVEDEGERIRISIPDRLRAGHEAHFAMLAAKFLGYVREPRSLPAWEKPNMIAKYYVTTKGVELARREDTGK